MLTSTHTSTSTHPHAHVCAYAHTSIHTAEEDDVDGSQWEPDHVGADLTRSSRSRRSADIIGMLVSIYGSKELFVNEYRSLLSDR